MPQGGERTPKARGSRPLYRVWPAGFSSWAREGLTWDLILIRVLPLGLFPQDRAGNLRERPTAGDRWRPLRTARLRWRVDQTWTKPRYGGVHAVCVAAWRD
jgi:hypothetical protein